MKFERISGFEGKIFIPEELKNCKKKYPCKDCMSCQFCSDERCDLCLKGCSSKNKEKKIERG